MLAKLCPVRNAKTLRTVIARKHTAHSSGLGQVRWFVEATAAWLMHFR